MTFNGLLVAALSIWMLFSAATETTYTLQRSNGRYQMRSEERLFGVLRASEVRDDTVMVPEVRCATRKGHESCVLYLTGSSGGGASIPTPNRSTASDLVGQILMLVPGGQVTFSTRNLQVSDRATGQAVHPSTLTLFSGPLLFFAIGLAMAGWGVKMLLARRQGVAR